MIKFLITKANSIIGVDKATWDFMKSRNYQGYREATAEDINKFGTKDDIKAFQKQTSTKADTESKEDKDEEQKIQELEKKPIAEHDDKTHKNTSNLTK